MRDGERKGEGGWREGGGEEGRKGRKEKRKEGQKRNFIGLNKLRTKKFMAIEHNGRL